MAVEVAVVGAGVIGCSVALELARAGYQVCVVDSASAPGMGSTSASSAVVRYHYRHRDEAVVAWESGRRWMEWATYLGATDSSGMARFIQTGLLVLPGEMLGMAKALGHLRDLGVEVHQLDPEQVGAKFASIDAARFGPPTLPSEAEFWADGRPPGNAYWIPQSGYINDPQLAAHNLASAATAIGVSFRFNTTVTGVLREGRVAGLQLADGSTLSAPIVVNVAGPWSSQLNSYAGVLDDFNTSTTPLEQEIVYLPAPPDFAGTKGFCVTDGDLGTYFRPEGEHGIAVGGMEAPSDPLRWLKYPEQARANVSAATWEMQTLRVGRRLPNMQVPGQPRGIVGVYDVTADWIPIYDRTSLDGYYVAIGTSGHGFKQAPFVGEMIASLITACETGHPHDSEPLRVVASWTGQTVDLGHFSRRRPVEAQAAMG